jgi:hypothetical protein
MAQECPPPDMTGEELIDSRILDAGRGAPELI